MKNYHTFKTITCNNLQQLNIKNLPFVISRYKQVFTKNVEERIATIFSLIYSVGQKFLYTTPRAIVRVHTNKPVTQGRLCGHATYFFDVGAVPSFGPLFSNFGFFSRELYKLQLQPDNIYHSEVFIAVTKKNDAMVVI